MLKKNSKISLLSVLYIFLWMSVAVFLSQSCGSEKDDSEDPPSVIDPPTRSSSVAILDVQIPVGIDKFINIGPKDFINGHHDQDIIATEAPEGIDIVSEELTARKNGIFLTAPGLLFKIDPPSPITISLSSRGRTQTIKREAFPGQTKQAVSFLSFPEVYPPVFREKYELTIESYPGIPQPFTYTFTFNIRRSDAAVIYADVEDGDPSSAIRLGMDTPRFVLSRIIPSEKCPNCTIEIENLNAKALVKEFVELPSIPVPGAMRISFPRRFTGLLVHSKATALSVNPVGNNTDVVEIVVSIPQTLTVVEPWCKKKFFPAGICKIVKDGVEAASYYKFINAVPSSVTSGSFGGTSGIASISITGNAKITIRRDGHTMESKVVEFDSGTKTAIDSPLLPTWVIDDLKKALYSGAPEFSY